MSREHAVEAWGGFVVLLSVALTWFVHPGFVWLTVFAGFMLFQQAFTGLCPMGAILKKFGVKSERELALKERSQEQRQE